MVAALEGEWHAIAERTQQIGRPGAERHHDMAREDCAIPEYHAPAISHGCDRLDVRLTDVAAETCKHPRIGLYHAAWRVHGRRLAVEEARLVNRHDVRLERRN